MGNNPPGSVDNVLAPHFGGGAGVDDDAAIESSVAYSGVVERRCRGEPEKSRSGAIYSVGYLTTLGLWTRGDNAGKVSVAASGPSRNFRDRNEDDDKTCHPH